MNNPLCILTLLFTLTACTEPSPEERCKAYGYEPQTTAFAECLYTLDEQAERLARPPYSPALPGTSR